MSGRHAPPNERFWAMVDRSGECWLWAGTRLPHGYGVFGRGRRDEGRAYAHRWLWESMNGSIPEGLCVLHHCDNPPCVNPDHLFLGTHADNMADMISKGRQRYAPVRGEDHPSAKLTWDEVRAIRSGGEDALLLAARYGVTRNHIYNVRSMRTWRTA